MHVVTWMSAVWLGGYPVSGTCVRQDEKAAARQGCCLFKGRKPGLFQPFFCSSPRDLSI